MSLPELTPKEVFAARTLKQMTLDRVRASKRVDAALAEKSAVTPDVIGAYVEAREIEDAWRIDFLGKLEHGARNAVTAEVLTEDLDPQELAQALDNLRTGVPRT